MLFKHGTKRHIEVAILFYIMSFWAGAVVAATKSIQGVRVWPSAENTRVVVDLSNDVQYKVFTLQNPDRIVLDIQEVQFKGKVNKDNLADSGIKNIRYSQHDPKTMRIVLDLEQAMRPKSFLLPPGEEAGYRLVIDLGTSKSSVATTTPTKIDNQPVKLTTREFLVAIDAGHGGKDTGAIGRYKQIREKDVVLSVAKKLQNLINAQPGMRAYLIRNGDYFIALRKRMELAREQGADLFISVHADSFNDNRASGASVFVLSEKGASNEASRWLAERENRADLVGGISLEDKGDLLASVLLDLSQTASQTASYELGGHLIGQLAKITDLHHNTVQHAGFMVLKSPDIPSVLVELGFLSNQKGEEKLASTAHQQALAKALFSGVNAYVAKRPLPIKHPSDFTVAKKISTKSKTTVAKKRA